MNREAHDPTARLKRDIARWRKELFMWKLDSAPDRTIRRLIAEAEKLIGHASHRVEHWPRGPEIWDSAYYRRRAAEVRTQATYMMDTVERDRLLEIGATFGQIAKAAEDGATKPKKSD
jgi:hypothetical protein